MATNSANPAKSLNPPTDPGAKYSQTPVFISAINELNTNTDQLQKRQKLLIQIEDVLSARYRVPNKIMSYIARFNHPRAAMTSNDIPSFETILSSITGAEQINLIIHSPGGDGTIVEKMVDMCRAHLSGAGRQFRVIVPNIAKSAATVLTLGADKILMGYCSELGPIDPQVVIAVSGVTQQISAFAFVESRDKLMEQIADAAKTGSPMFGLLQQHSVHQ
jgi:ClpP class serine protease